MLLCLFNYVLISFIVFSCFSYDHSRIEKFCTLESMDRISLALFQFSAICLILCFLRKIYLVDFYNNYFSIREKALYFWDPKITLGNLETVFLITELFLTLTITLISKLFSYSYKQICVYY